MSQLSSLRALYQSHQAQGLKLDMQRGQPSDANFDLSNSLLTIIGPAQVRTSSGIDTRNYPGGIAGLTEARELFANVLGVKPSQTMVDNNSSMKVLSNVLMWALLRGLKNSPEPWVHARPKIMVAVPGYDRHFNLLDALGFEIICVPNTGHGPDVDAVQAIAAGDSAVKGMLFVPTYSNPTGETISDDAVRRLASMKTAAVDFTIFADEAYLIHHLADNGHRSLNLVRACHEAGNPHRAYLFSSTSKITFAGAGVAYVGTSEENVAYLSGLLSREYIGPNKIEQLRHVKFLNEYPGGLDGLMRAHAALLKPRFQAALQVLDSELNGTGLAQWTRPVGGYFISLDTNKPIADTVVRLAAQAGVALTPAGATFPHGKDPRNSNIRLAPTRPPVADVKLATQVLCTCIKLASAEYDQQRL